MDTPLAVQKSDDGRIASSESVIIEKITRAELLSTATVQRKSFFGRPLLELIRGCWCPKPRIPIHSSRGKLLEPS